MYNAAFYTAYNWDWALTACTTVNRAVCLLHCPDTRVFTVLGHLKRIQDFPECFTANYWCRVQGPNTKLFTVHCSRVQVGAGYKTFHSTLQHSASVSRIQESPRWISALVPPISPTCFYPTWEWWSSRSWQWLRWWWWWWWWWWFWTQQKECHWQSLANSQFWAVQKTL